MTHPTARASRQTLRIDLVLQRKLFHELRVERVHHRSPLRLRLLLDLPVLQPRLPPLCVALRLLHPLLGPRRVMQLLPLRLVLGLAAATPLRTGAVLRGVAAR